MERFIRRIGVSVAMAAAIALCVAATASATSSVYVDPSDHQMHIYLDTTNGAHMIVSDAWNVPNGVEAYDYFDEVVPGDGCESIDVHTVRCYDVTYWVRVHGGGGNDSVNAAYLTKPFFANGAGGNDTVYGGSSTNILSGNEGADRLTGGNSADQIIGHSGNDTIDGKGGDDTIWGEAGADNLAGGSGNDGIYAKDGANDTINCGNDADTVSADLLPNDATVTGCESVNRS